MPGAWDGLLGGEARAALAERHPFFAAEMHPTRLERYIDCPFAFLLRDVLRLDAPDEPNDTLEMDAREFGTLAHKILFETYERVISEELPLAGALERRRRRLAVVLRRMPNGAASPARPCRGRSAATCCAKTCASRCGATRSLPSTTGAR